MKNFIIGDTFVVGTVTSSGPQFGFAVTKNRNIVYFNVEHGHEILPGENHPEFTDELPQMPRVGEDIIMFLSTGPKGPYAHAWGLRIEYFKAIGDIRRKAPKLAPKCPPVQLLAPQSQHPRRCPTTSVIGSLEEMVSSAEKVA